LFAAFLYPATLTSSVQKACNATELNHTKPPSTPPLTPPPTPPTHSPEVDVGDVSLVGPEPERCEVLGVEAGGVSLQPEECGAVGEAVLTQVLLTVPLKHPQPNQRQSACSLLLSPTATQKTTISSILRPCSIGLQFLLSPSSVSVKSLHSFF
jgi:hypothetical protein